MNNVEEEFQKLQILEKSNQSFNYQYVTVFKNPSKLPINQIHLERIWYELKHDIPKDLDYLELSEDVLKKKIYNKKSEIIPALDKRWLPKIILYKFQPYIFTFPKEEDISFLANNLLYIDSLDYFLKCNFHQFWCTILFEPSAAVSLRSFILNPILPYQVAYLEDEYAKVYSTVFEKFLQVYKRLIQFRASQDEYLSEEYAYEKLLEKKLINLPIVNTLALIYKDFNADFVNSITLLYFNDTTHLDFQFKEVEGSIDQTLLILEMIGGHVCGFRENAVVVPIAVSPRPSIFNLTWVYSVVSYLLNTMSLLHTLLEYYKPAMELCIKKDLPFRLPFTYTSIYRELYELMSNREELEMQTMLCERVFDEINLGRSEFIDVYHMFVSYCLDKTLECLGDDKKQEELVELYLKLMNVALEDDYFICDYNVKYNVASQNEMFESCTALDTTRTEFIVSCINKLPRHKKLIQLLKLKNETIEDVFKRFKPPEIEPEVEPVAGPSETNQKRNNEVELDVKIKEIMDMFPHFGDGFILKCLEAYDFNSSDVINAILEENLPPHLYEIPFDEIRIPPEPEPEKPVLAYRGKKPDYDDALALLNDKEEIKQLKPIFLEKIQYSNDYLYDDEYDDRDDDDVPIKVADNPLEKELLTYNPNHDDVASDSSESEEELSESSTQKTNVRSGTQSGSGDKRNRMNFCEDPAVIRERREAKFRSHHRPPQQTKSNVVGKPKGQGQEKDVLKARDKKNVNKSSRANHNRKSGAQWKRSRGMFPM
ncbi:activating signal cointegrator 1 complex subunit 2 [Diorhabda sublineata]|uniref:activating signal cointegrator 1 complex subunit 2 n=1 Tax=Diorhabda sublineata TaxID=1163346 RepID=UPI0024E0D0BC|nr:activating signal cointegrator 1 complex subunit 2 [Diorhabda sublineata]